LRILTIYHGRRFLIKSYELVMFNENQVLTTVMTNVKIKAEENGPLLVEVDGKTTITLCRCGKSQTQPSCDGTHAKIGFKATASEIKVTE